MSHPPPTGARAAPAGADRAADLPTQQGGHADIAALIPIVRRIVAARVQDGPTAEDLVQETLVRVLAAAPRVEPGMLESYAIVTARNVVASLWRERDRHRRNQHRVVDLLPEETHEDGLVAQEEQSAVVQALARLSQRERDTLLAHEVSGQDTRSLAGLEEGLAYLDSRTARTAFSGRVVSGGAQ